MTCNLKNYIGCSIGSSAVFAYRVEISFQHDLGTTCAQSSGLPFHSVILALPIPGQGTLVGKVLDCAKLDEGRSRTVTLQIQI